MNHIQLDFGIVNTLVLLASLDICYNSTHFMPIILKLNKI